MILYLLFETATGYALFEKQEFDEVSTQLTQVQKSISNMESFSKIVRLKGFVPFTSADVALKNILAVQEGTITDELKQFLEQNLPKVSKKAPHALAVQDNKLAGKISEELKVTCKINDVISELFRGIRVHFVKFLKDQDLKDEDLVRAELGLAHSSSRNKVSTDINREDKHIIQSSALLETIDKNLNTFAMRIKEWYSWHFPELSKIVNDNLVFVRCANLLGNRDTIQDDIVEKLDDITGDGEISQKIVEASRASMGQELSELDASSLMEFTARVMTQYKFRDELQEYLTDRMTAVAPNLTSLIGENVGAKLISKAGSLMSLAKYPASTIQILGAEKALFRALKTKGNTPKYGLLFNSTFISRANAKDKGRVSRFLANKCAIASRLD